MTLADLIAQGESLDLEFKREANDSELAKAVACLANGQGGILLVGVDDDGVVRGAKPRHRTHTDPDRVAAVIQNHTEPGLPVAVRVEQVDGLDVILIDVPRADPGPVATKDGFFTKRVLNAAGHPECVPMTPHEVVSIGMVTRGMDYAASPARGATVGDLDPAEFDRFRRMCATTGDRGMSSLSDLDLLRALGLVPVSDRISLGAVLLFGTSDAVHRWIPTAEFLFQDLRRTPLAANDRIAGPLFAVAEELRRRIDERNSITELMAGLHRVEVSLIPQVTRREAVANAIVHRDYAELGPTQVQIGDATFTVANPGGFPPGVTVHNLLDQSRPRSPALADAFRRAGLVERRGKGVNEMFEQQLRAGRDAPDYSRTTPDSVIVSVPLGTADLDLIRFLVTFENESQRDFSLDELRVVHELRAGGSATGSELTEALGLGPPVVRAAATTLVSLGILEARGNGRNRRFHLTARFYDLAEDRNAYVRIRGADPLQQERMILDYVAAYGSITRSQAAQLCQTTPGAARTVLKRLVEAGRLALIGERRAARYEARR